MLPLNRPAIDGIIELPPLTLPPHTPLHKAIAAMTSTKTSYVLVMEQQELVGIFTERDVIRLTALQLSLEQAKLADCMTREVVTLQIHELADIFAATQLFSQNRIRHLPIFDAQQQLLGVITPLSVRNAMKPEYLLRYIRVAEVMVRSVICGAPNDTILTLAQHMTLHRVSCIVIVAPGTSIPIGIVSERDITQFHTLGLDFNQVQAQAVMSTPLTTVQPNESLWNVHQRMQQLHVRRLVVREITGELAGIVTQTQMLKLLNPTELYHVIGQMQQVIEQQTRQLQQLNDSLQSVNAQLYQLATVDELTQIVNRRYFNTYLEHVWQQLVQSAKPLSLILCDVDDFKRYNDTYGHLKGDDCLVRIAQVLRKITRRTTDLVARYGGEEFAIVLPECDAAGAARVAQDILQQVRTLRIPHTASRVADYVTVSAGVVTTIPDQHSSPHTLLHAADQVLYQSKQQGRNTYSYKVLTTEQAL